jgi:hypothetical protein
MFEGLKTKAATTAKRAGLLSGGLLAIAVGAAFLTAAAWIYLANVMDAQMAALIIGGVYAGLGFVMVGLASSGGSREEPAAGQKASAHGAGEQGAGAQPPLMQAFLQGMQAGVSATQSRR